MQLLFYKTISKTGPTGAEKLVEVQRFVRDLVKKGLGVGNADGGPALQSGLKSCAHSSTKVAHNKEIYADVVRFNKSDLCSGQNVQCILQAGLHIRD